MEEDNIIKINLNKPVNRNVNFCLDIYQCPNCLTTNVVSGDRYCFCCGKEIKWIENEGVQNGKT